MNVTKEVGGNITKGIYALGLGITPIQSTASGFCATQGILIVKPQLDGDKEFSWLMNHRKCSP
jgi:hypothetical protein